MTSTALVRRPSAASVAAEATPKTRDRYVDFLRLAAIIGVIAGHWLMAAVTVTADGVSATNTLALVPSLQYLTWVAQVMPVFFFVGGFAHSLTWRSTQRRGGTYREFLAGRMVRLLRPVLVMVAVWAPVAFLLELSALDESTTRLISKLATQLLWFVAVYIVMCVSAPYMVALHDQFRWVVPGGLLGAVVVGDIVGGPLGALNFAFVWLFAHQLGFFYADGTFTAWSQRTFAVVGAGALTSLAVLTGSGAYPVSMVGLPGTPSNMNPPNLAICVLTVWLVSLAMLARPLVTRLLERPTLWRVVIVGNSVIMTMLLWHLTAFMVVTAAALAARFPFPAGGSIGWWVSRPLVFGASLVVLAGLVRLFGRYERVPVTAAAPNAHRAVLAAGCAFVGTLMLAVTGLAGLAGTEVKWLAVIPAHPAAGIAAFLAATRLVFRKARR